MKIIKTSIPGLFLFNPKKFEDQRGYFMEIFNKNLHEKYFGKFNLAQENVSRSKKNVIRGLHFQTPPFSQAKIVRCIEGEIIDIAVDIRKKSNTYGCYEKTILSSKNQLNLFIPHGFAHGFKVTSEFATISYKVDNYHTPEHESGIYWNDDELNIDWEIEKTDAIVSSKDKKMLKLNQILNPF